MPCDWTYIMNFHFDATVNISNEHTHTHTPTFILNIDIYYLDIDALQKQKRDKMNKWMTTTYIEYKDMNEWKNQEWREDSFHRRRRRRQQPTILLWKNR